MFSPSSVGSEPAPSQVSTGTALTTNAVTASGAVQANASQSQITGATKISSLEDLKEKAPEVYQKTLQAIAWSICTESRKHQERMKKYMRNQN